MANLAASARGGASYSSSSSSPLWFASSLHRSFSGFTLGLKPFSNPHPHRYNKLQVHSNNSEFGIWDRSRNSKISANKGSVATMKQLWVEETKKLNMLKLQHQLNKCTVDEPPVKINPSLKTINRSNGSLTTHVLDKKTEESTDTLEKLLDSKKANQESSEKKPKDARERLCQVYNEVLVVDNVEEAKRVVRLLTTKYRDFIHGCDTEASCF